MATSYQSSKKRNGRKYFLFAGIIIVLLVAGAFTWHHYHPAKPKTVNLGAGTATANPNVPGSTANNSTSSSISASKDSNTNQPGTAPSPSVQPSKPIGDFVSNHHPNLSGSPAPNTETSVCSTTAGVTCQIRFTSTSSGKVVELPAQTTNADGSTIWNWELQDIGLTTGTWQITAVAMNGAKTASANDALQLVVAQ